MRAGGLLVGAGLLVASWMAWFATSEPADLLPAGPPAAAARAIALPQAAQAAQAATKVSAIPVFAEVRGGPGLAELLAAQRIPGRLTVALTTRPPSLLRLAADEDLRGLIADPRDVPGAHDPGFVAALAVPPEGAWVALYLDGLLLAIHRVEPGRSLVRFELSTEKLDELLGLAPLS